MAKPATNTTKSKTKSVAKVQKTWKPLTLSAYAQQCHELVTHSVKGVNTNAAPCGVRVIPQSRADFPYACVRFGAQHIELDYIKNSTSPFAASVATEQIAAALRPQQPDFVNVPTEEIAMIRNSIAPLLRQPEVNAPNLVSPRAKQILFSDGNGGDVSLTPLHSGGFSAHLHGLVDAALNSRAKKAIAEGAAAIPQRFDTVTIKVGGDKLQNAGRARLVGAMQRAYLFSVPHETDPALRKAFSVYHKGVSLRPFHAAIQQYGEWLLGKRKDDGVLHRTLEGMRKEREIVQSMAENVLNRARTSANLVAPLVESGDLPGLVSPALSLAIRGAIDTAQRSDTWRDAFSVEVASQIVNATARDRQSLAGLSGTNTSALSNYIKEMLA